MSRPDGFLALLRAAGLMLDVVTPDGRRRRVRAHGDSNGQRSGWYVLHAGPPMAGAYGNWKTGDNESWCDGGVGALSEVERMQLREAVVRAQRKQQAELAQRQAAARHLARERWQRADAASVDHPYLVAKGVGVHGLRQLDGKLLVPLRDSQGRLWSLQTIAADGSKRFLAGGRKRGLYYPVGRAVNEVVCVAEGYATAATIHEVTGHPTAVAFDAGNLEPVACALRAKFPSAAIVVCADDDAATAARLGVNPGLVNAQRAAAAVGGVVAMPPRPSNETSS